MGGAPPPPIEDICSQLEGDFENLDRGAAIDATARTIGRVGRKSGEFWDWSGDFDVFSVVYTVDRGKLGTEQMGWDDYPATPTKRLDRRGYSRGLPLAQILPRLAFAMKKMMEDKNLVRRLARRVKLWARRRS